MLAQGEDLAPIPGTKRVSRLEENVAADSLELPPEVIDRLSAIAPPAGDRYPDIELGQPLCTTRAIGDAEKTPSTRPLPTGVCRGSPDRRPVVSSSAHTFGAMTAAQQKADGAIAELLGRDGRPVFP